MNKLILVDSDGTLRRTDGSISDRTKNAIKKNLEVGNKVCIATGRPRYHSKEIKELAGASNIVISSNGSEIYDINDDKVIDALYIDKEEVYFLIDYAYKNDLRFLVTIDDNEYVTKEIKNEKQFLLDENYKEFLKDKDVKQCMFIDEKEDLINEIKEIVDKNDKLTIINEIRNDDDFKFKWFSIGNSKSSKGFALKSLASYLDIPLENTIAIGNDYNDVPMFKEANVSVAVDNATTDIKKMVNVVTKSNDEDGVAVYLEGLYEDI